MKKILIGAALLLSGVLDVIGIVIAGSISATLITSWGGTSRVWYAIFAGRSKYGMSDGMGLGVLFVIGVLLLIAGLVLLIIEYRKADK